MACSKAKLFCRQQLPEDVQEYPLTPYDVDLEQVFRHLNSVCLDGAIQNWNICWDNTRTRNYVGFVDYEYRCVVVNPRVCEYMQYEEIASVILHQMIHIYHWHHYPDVDCDIHDPVFKSLEQRALAASWSLSLPELR